MATGSAWAQVANTACQAGVGVLTGNPLPVVTGAVTFAGFLYDTWRSANANPSPSMRPTQPLSELLDAAIDRPGSATATMRQPDLRPAWSPPAASSGIGSPAGASHPTRQEPPQGGQPASDAATREGIERRAAEIARSPDGGSDFDNWVRAVVEVAVAQRAAEIARSPDAGSDFDNWLRAERELKVGQRAQEIARSEDAGSDFDNWLRAERDLRISQRARLIARTRPTGGEQDNWFQAEREIANEQELIATRAREIAASPYAGGELDNWLRAERELRETARIGPW